jgi:2-(1,2-epoxy-1,2-dihydrophenyl)acetyl-CoA isomerase
MPSECVVTRIEQAVAWIAINNPDQWNAIDERTARAFRDSVLAIANNAAVRAVVIQGTGACFGVGGNLRDLQRDPVSSATKIIDPMHDAIRIMASMKPPTIAALHGAVAGGSLSLALACDFAFASENARFTLAYSNVGTSPDLSGSWHLARIVGLRQAMWLAMVNETLDAQRALELGLVNRVVPNAELKQAVGIFACGLAPLDAGRYCCDLHIRTLSIGSSTWRRKASLRVRVQVTSERAALHDWIAASHRSRVTRTTGKLREISSRQASTSTPDLIFAVGQQ